MKPLPLVDGCLLISGTFLETLAQCNRKAEYYKLWKRVPAEEKAATNFGKGYHEGLAFHYRTQQFGTSDEERQEKATSILTSWFEHNPAPEGDWRNLNWAIELYNKYTSKFEHEQFDLIEYKKPVLCEYCLQGSIHTGSDIDGDAISIQCQWCNGTGQNKIMSEVPFAFPLFKHKLCDVVVHGFLDLPVQLGGRKWIGDFKTSSMLGDSFWQGQKVSLQQKTYAWAFHKITGEEPFGYIIRAIGTKQPPLYVQNGKPNRSGEIKLLSNWWHDNFQEQRFWLGKGELDEYYQTACSLVEEFLWHYERNFMPMRTTSCVTKYKCPYYDVCTLFPPSDRESLLSSESFKDKVSPKV